MKSEKVFFLASLDLFFLIKKIYVNIENFPIILANGNLIPVFFPSTNLNWLIALIITGIIGAIIIIIIWICKNKVK